MPLASQPTGMASWIIHDLLELTLGICIRSKTLNLPNLLVDDDQQELGGASEVMLEEPFSSSASFSSGRISSTASEREDIHVNDSGNAIVVLSCSLFYVC